MSEYNNNDMQQCNQAKRCVTLHYITLKVIWSGLKYMTARSLYARCTKLDAVQTTVMREMRETYKSLIRTQTEITGCCDMS